jgi:glycine betaine catabolism B
MTTELIHPPTLAPAVPPRKPFTVPLLRSMRFLSSESIGGEVTSFSFRPRRRLDFRAGQHGLLIVPKGGSKPFSIASSPTDKTITIATRLASASKFKRALAALEPGDRVRFFAPLMNFTTEATGREMVFLAQGVGITPIRSMLLDIVERDLGKQTTLVHVGRDHAFRIETDRLATRAEYPLTSDSFREQVLTTVEDCRDATFMISGAPAFVASTAAFLRDQAVPGSQIKSDSMTGY